MTIPPPQIDAPKTQDVFARSSSGEPKRNTGSDSTFESYLTAGVKTDTENPETLDSQPIRGNSETEPGTQAASNIPNNSNSQSPVAQAENTNSTSETVKTAPSETTVEAETDENVSILPQVVPLILQAEAALNHAQQTTHDAQQATPDVQQATPDAQQASAALTPIQGYESTLANPQNVTPKTVQEGTPILDGDSASRTVNQNQNQQPATLNTDELGRLSKSQGSLSAGKSSGRIETIEIPPETAPTTSTRINNDTNSTTARQVDRVEQVSQNQDSGSSGTNDFTSFSRNETVLPPAQARAEQVETTVQYLNIGDRGSSVASLPLAPPSVGTPESTLAAGSPNGLTEEPGSSVTSSKMIRGMNAMVGHRGGVMTMRLDPPELGSMRVQMSIHNGTVTARFEAESMEAQSVLRQSLPALKASLEGQGLQVDKLSVQTNQSQTQQELSDRSSDNHTRGQERHDASGQQSRGRHERNNPFANNQSETTYQDVQRASELVSNDM